MKCQDCKHWRHHVRDIGECERIPVEDEMTRPEETTHLALMLPGYVYGGCSLYTRAEFGCVLFEPKEVQP